MSKKNKIGEVDVKESFEEKKEEITKFVVVRDGHRVSENTYETTDDPYAEKEKEFWQNIVDTYPDGTKIQIVQFDKKLHRTW